MTPPTTSFWLASCLVLVASTAVLLVEGQEYFSNIDYLGAGYDAIFGNPLDVAAGKPVDPGFRESVFAKKYETGTTTADRRFWVPDYMSVLPKLYCSYNTEVDEIMTMSDYFKATSQQVGLGLGNAQFSFQLSYGWGKARQVVQFNHSRIASAEALCVQYQAKLPFIDKVVPFTDDFVGYVTRLAEAPDDKERFWEFLERYGTHVLVDMEMGAKSIMQSVFTESHWLLMNSQSRKIGAQASFYGWTGSIMTGTEKKLQETFETLRSDVYMSFIGSLPSQDGNFSTWASKADQNPIPVIYKLVKISKYLTRDYFPKLSGIEAVAAPLEQAIDLWCSHNSNDPTLCQPLPSFDASVAPQHLN